MDALTAAQKYFAAWNSRDAGAIVALFTDLGTYTDPVSGKLTGQSIGDYAGGLFAAFPDLSFEVVSHGLVNDRNVAAQWIMRGTNTGPFMGMPPTDKTICVPGADFMTLEDGRIRSLQGYFDSRAVPEQLGLQVIVQPRSIGPVAFGTSTVMHIGKPRMPGAFSITSLQVKSDQEGAEVTSYGRQMLTEVAKMEGFVGSLTGNAGHHYCTVTAWENPEQPKQIYQSTSHNEIMGRFYNSDFTLGGAFGVWVPVHQHYLVRCTQCKRMCDFERSAGKCSCGEALPDPPPYW